MLTLKVFWRISEIKQTTTAFCMHLWNMHLYRINSQSKYVVVFNRLPLHCTKESSKPIYFIVYNKISQMWNRNTHLIWRNWPVWILLGWIGSLFHGVMWCSAAGGRVCCSCLCFKQTNKQTNRRACVCASDADGVAPNLGKFQQFRSEITSLFDLQMPHPIKLNFFCSPILTSLYLDLLLLSTLAFLKRYTSFRPQMGTVVVITEDTTLKTRAVVKLCENMSAKDRFLMN